MSTETLPFSPGVIEESEGKTGRSYLPLYKIISVWNCVKLYIKLYVVIEHIEMYINVCKRLSMYINVYRCI